MKKKILLLTTIFVLAIAMLGLTACPGPQDPDADPSKTDGAVYDVSKLYSSADLAMPDYVKELKQEDGGWIVKTESEIVTGTKIILNVSFKDGKFEEVDMTIMGVEQNRFTDALVIELDTTPAPTIEVPEPEPSSVTKSNNPTAVKGQSIRLPRALRSGANNSTANPFDFDTKPASGEPTDHQIVGTAAYECLEYSVAAYRFVLAAKNVFGSYANYLEATEKTVDSAWKFGGTLATESATSAAVKIEKVLEFPLSYTVFVTSSAPAQHGQSITAMVRIDKTTHKVLKADYAFFHVSEYRSDVDKYITSLDNAKTAVAGTDVTAKVYSAKSGDPAAYDLNGVTNATLTNSVLVNAFNAAFAYYNANLKA